MYEVTVKILDDDLGDVVKYLGPYGPLTIRFAPDALHRPDSPHMSELGERIIGWMKNHSPVPWGQFQAGIEEDANISMGQLRGGLSVLKRMGLAKKNIDGEWILTGG